MENEATEIKQEDTERTWKVDGKFADKIAALIYKQYHRLPKKGKPQNTEVSKVNRLLISNSGRL